MCTFLKNKRNEKNNIIIEAINIFFNISGDKFCTEARYNEGTPIVLATLKIDFHIPTNSLSFVSIPSSSFLLK